ncbi:MAG: PDZ domain-containing protein [Nitriliruptor sp.]|uniref:PDZ domain-containing protein n=1 Tax=Nitriliruptor sp. TaxID=2448056 RepID=UPI0034A0219F
MHRWWSLLLALVAVTIGVVAVAAAAVASGEVPCGIVSTQPACEVALVPGPTEDTIGLVRIEGATTFPSTGELLLTTVAVRDGLDLGTWWEARRSTTVDTVPRETIYPPDLDPTETAEQNALLMEDSQMTAALAALSVAGYDVDGAATGAAVAAIESDAVTDALTVGDVITGVDGTEVRDAASLVDQVVASSPGDEATLQVRAEDGTTRSVDVTYGRNPADRTRAYIGVLLRTELDLPVDISIDAGVIGGPSAGLMFALGVLDLLGDEDLTGGAIVAGTGTIDVDGRVGPVGGVRQKLVGATDRGGVSEPAAVFLVPRANLAEARRAPVGRDLLLVPIDDLSGALAALDALRDGREPAEAFALRAAS